MGHSTIGSSLPVHLRLSTMRNSCFKQHRITRVEVDRLMTIAIANGADAKQMNLMPSCCRSTNCWVFGLSVMRYGCTPRSESKRGAQQLVTVQINGFAEFSRGMRPPANRALLQSSLWK
jgi:hypothetical protein